MSAVLEQHTVLPPSQDQTSKQELEGLFALLSRPDGRARLVGPDATEVELPGEVYMVLREVAEAMAQGLAVSIAPLHAVLTTQQAADMLNISRPTLVKLLEEGRIPYEKPGRHRRVRLKDLLDYQQQSRQERRAALDEMTREAHQDGTADSINEFVQTR